MSSRRLDIADDARLDVQDILQATSETWGKVQRARYARQLRDAMRQLTRYPELGQRSDQFAIGLRSRLVNQHVIYYLVDDEAVTVVRVLHIRMDAAARFRSD